MGNLSAAVPRSGHGVPAGPPDYGAWGWIAVWTIMCRGCDRGQHDPAAFAFIVMGDSMPEFQSDTVICSPART